MHTDTPTPQRTKTLAASAAGALLSACAPLLQPAVPASLAAPVAQSPIWEVQATGVQIYACQAPSSAADAYAWALQAPRAALFDATGKQVGRHYAGPTWESDDGSTVSGTLIARVESPDPQAIAWLLLGATGNTGRGILGEVKSIQRLYTVGGKPPTEACGPGTAGRQVEVPYKATYRFYAVAAR